MTLAPNTIHLLWRTAEVFGAIILANVAICVIFHYLVWKDEDEQ